jgi:large subunit ribosomal protein L30
MSEVKAEKKPKEAKAVVKAETKPKAEKTVKAVKPLTVKQSAKKKDGFDGKLRITLIKSTIGALENHKANVEALGLKKIRDVVIHDNTPAIAGMVFKVKHLVKVEKISQ